MTTRVLFVRSTIHLADGLCWWACVCGAGRSSYDGKELIAERRDHQDTCAGFIRTGAPAGEFPLRVLRPGWYEVAALRPCVICDEPTDIRSARGRACHLACADTWTTTRNPSQASSSSPRVAVAPAGSDTEGSPGATRRPRETERPGASAGPQVTEVVGEDRFLADPVLTTTAFQAV